MPRHGYLAILGGLDFRYLLAAPFRGNAENMIYLLGSVADLI